MLWNILEKKDEKRHMLKIHYKIVKNQNSEIVRCFGNDGIILLPEQLDGMPVYAVGDYAFSPYKKKEEENVLSETIGESSFSDTEMKLLCGTQVSEVVLPHSTEEIGKYVFYGCPNLKVLKFSDSLLRTGTGIFTGCEIAQLHIDFYKGNQSCMKDVVSETRYSLMTILRYHTSQGKKEARLVFPEYYEEAVENTPARIIENHFNGTGYKYRQCFFKGQIDFGKYDALFEDAAVQENSEIVEKLLFGRLLYPYALETKAKRNYMDYLRDNLLQIVPSLVEKEDIRALDMLSKELLWTKSILDHAIDYAAWKEKPKVLSLLLDEKNQLFPQTTKIFDL